MTHVGEVNEKVTHLATTQRQETHELQNFCLMASSYEREAADARWALAYSKSRSQAMDFKQLVRTEEAGPKMDQLMLVVAVSIVPFVSYPAQPTKLYSKHKQNIDDNHDSGQLAAEGMSEAARDAPIVTFLKLPTPKIFKVLEGDVGLTQWFEKMECCIPY
ncbi:hypothetical protein Tco_0367995 [Tanacetum coccineum]